MHQNTEPKNLCLTAEKKVVILVLAACQSKNFGRPVTYHAACRIEQNGTVRYSGTICTAFSRFWTESCLFLPFMCIEHIT